MIACPHCGIHNDDIRRRCFRCKGELPLPEPPPLVSAGEDFGQSSAGMLPALSDPYAPVRYIARSPGEVDEEFLDQFTWAPGCWTYFLSRAMWLFLVGSIGVRLFDTLLGLWSGTIQSGDVGSGLLALLLGLVELAAFFGLLIWAGKVGRRRRWEQLNWRDFETFRKDEAARQTLGIVFWALQIFLIAGSIFKGLTGAGSGGP